ncbi:MAG: hypothetical protein ACFFDN_43395 [Candidatus Hodarchaeota archaeon]
MMLPCFKCKNCYTNWIIDIYSDSKDGVIQKFISQMCCPICGKKNLRVCFIQKLQDKIPDIIQESVKNYDKIPHFLV